MSGAHRKSRLVDQTWIPPDRQKLIPCKWRRLPRKTCGQQRVPDWGWNSGQTPTCKNFTLLSPTHKKLYNVNNNKLAVPMLAIPSVDRMNNLVFRKRNWGYSHLRNMPSLVNKEAGIYIQTFLTLKPMILQLSSLAKSDDITFLLLSGNNRGNKLNKTHFKYRSDYNL